VLIAPTFRPIRGDPCCLLCAISRLYAIFAGTITRSNGEL